MSLKFFVEDTYPYVEAQLQDASGSVYEDITGYTFAGELVPTNGGTPITVAGTFEITDASAAQFRLKQAAADFGTEGIYILRVTYTRPSSGGVFTRDLSENIIVQAKN